MDPMRARSPDELPYAFSHLDNLMEAAGLDVLIATSKHNVRYLLGGYQFQFFSAMDAIGHSRYLPLLVYVRGDPGKTAYVANRMEGMEHQNHPFWVPNFFPTAWGSIDAMGRALDHLRQTGVASHRIGVEPSFLPSDAHQVIVEGLPDAHISDATGVMERLRAVKTPAELDLLREATTQISAAMAATVTGSRKGDTKARIIERLRREETDRGLMFEYCLLTLGASHNRAAGDQTWQDGEVLSIDSGGNLHGYIGDICRMGVLGRPDAELQDLLAQVDSVQQAAFGAVKAGTRGGDMIAAGQAELRRQPDRAHTDFFAHGMGLISHEAPFLMTNHPVAYEGVDADHPLKAGMVLSIETTMQHPTRGFIKLEDTVAVTDDGYELFAAEDRVWTVCDA